MRAWQQPGGVREAQRLASGQVQQFTPFHHQFSSTFAPVLTAKNFLRDSQCRRDRLPVRP
jgi:hypothetical protein